MVWFHIVNPKITYNNASPAERCQIDLKKLNDSDKYCDGATTLSRKEVAAQKLETKERERRSKLTPYQRCVEDYGDIATEEGGIYSCNKDGTHDYISYSEMENEIAEAQVENNSSYSNCHPSYSPCIENAGYDLDCSDVGQRVNVSGYDEYGLDGDGDGVGCDIY